MKKQKVFYFLIFIFFLLLIKTDYRIASGVNCCGDDFDYYIHAQTLAIDYDFDRHLIKTLESMRGNLNMLPINRNIVMHNPATDQVLVVKPC